MVRASSPSSAADAALVVDNLDALSALTFDAYGGDQVIDITSDGGVSESAARSCGPPGCFDQAWAALTDRYGRSDAARPWSMS
jgi:hypothetical protein